MEAVDTISQTERAVTRRDREAGVPRSGGSGTDVGVEPDPVTETYKRDIDCTLIRENLKLSVEERFLKLMALQRFADELRQAGREARKRG